MFSFKKVFFLIVFISVSFFSNAQDDILLHSIQYKSVECINNNIPQSLLKKQNRAYISFDIDSVGEIKNIEVKSEDENLKNAISPIVVNLINCVPEIKEYKNKRWHLPLFIQGIEDKTKKKK